MFVLKVKSEENKHPITVETSRSKSRLERRSECLNRLSGIEYAEVINLNPPKGGGRDAQKTFA